MIVQVKNIILSTIIVGVLISVTIGDNLDTGKDLVGTSQSLVYI